MDRAQGWMLLATPLNLIFFFFFAFSPV
jgi:Calcium-activated SK potassium channel/Ion channel